LFSYYFFLDIFFIIILGATLPPIFFLSGILLSSFLFLIAFLTASIPAPKADVVAATGADKTLGIPLRSFLSLRLRFASVLVPNFLLS
jgi:hypothetical protein